jgi:hypothetical protein
MTSSVAVVWALGSGLQALGSGLRSLALERERDNEKHRAREKAMRGDRGPKKKEGREIG